MVEPWVIGEIAEAQVQTINSIVMLKDGSIPPSAKESKGKEVMPVNLVPDGMHEDSTGL